MQTTVVAALSGGMDSLLSLALLKEAGCRVHALHAYFLPRNRRLEAAADRLAEQCERLGASFETVDASREFERLVIAPFIHDYAAGRTPNPCALCNRTVKFGLLFDLAMARGADYLATGHYARIADHPEHGPLLCRAADPRKDQTYFLSLVDQGALDRVRFPLHDKLKTDVPGMLIARGLEPPVAGESQEVCFIPGDDYRAFLLQRGANLGGPGPVVLADGRTIGEHHGLWRYTLGQRRGLGIAWSEPLYVLDKKLDENSLVVGGAQDLGVQGLFVEKANWFVPQKSLPETVLAKTRYRQRARPARVLPRGSGFELRFAAPETQPTPGQVAALYDHDGHLLAGGVITRALAKGSMEGYL